MQKPHAHLQKSLQIFKLMGIKLYEELRTQGTHRLSSNACRKRGITLQVEPRRKNEKNTGPLIFYTDAIYKNI